MFSAIQCVISCDNSISSLTSPQRRLMVEAWLLLAALKVFGLVYVMIRGVRLPSQVYFWFLMIRVDSDASCTALEDGHAVRHVGGLWYLPCSCRQSESFTLSLRLLLTILFYSPCSPITSKRWSRPTHHRLMLPAHHKSSTATRMCNSSVLVSWADEP